MYIYWSDKFSSFVGRTVKSDDVICNWPTDRKYKYIIEQINLKQYWKIAPVLFLFSNCHNTPRAF